MKKLIVIAIFSCISGISMKSMAQDENVNPYVLADPMDFRQNNIKLNLFSLPLSNLSVQYERALSPKASVALGLRYQPTTNLPFRSSIKSAMGTGNQDSTAINFIENTKISNWAVTPEFRYYFGKKPLNGFYIAPFARLSGYQITWDYTYTDANQKDFYFRFDGKGTSITGGLLFGAQWHVGKRLLLDWWILGPSLGTINFSMDGLTDLSAMADEDRLQLEEDLKEVMSGMEVEVSDRGVHTKGTSLFGGVRTGFCIGYTF